MRLAFTETIITELISTIRPLTEMIVSPVRGPRGGSPAYWWKPRIPFELVVSEEDCLSVCDEFSNVTRPKNIMGGNVCRLHKFLFPCEDIWVAQQTAPSPLIWYKVCNCCFRNLQGQMGKIKSGQLSDTTSWLHLPLWDYYHENTALKRSLKKEETHKNIFFLKVLKCTLIL